MLKTSETYIIDVDIDNIQENSLLSVSKFTGGNIKEICTFTGKDAETLYFVLTKGDKNGN